MAQDKSGKQDEALVSCDVCLKEIPASEARSDEADDYVRHFCGLECYDKWRAGVEESKGEK
jgi:hypothetical protein